MTDYETIKELAKNKGMSLADLAAELDYEYSSFYRAIKRNTMRLEKREKLCEVLGINMSQIWPADKRTRKESEEVQNYISEQLTLYKKLVESQAEQIALLKKEIDKK
jgi:lambda repressor-like predicted transcriptional regulator